MSLQQRCKLLAQAKCEVDAAKCEETPEGNARKGAHHYLLAMELVTMAVHDFPFDNTASAKYFLFQCRAKMDLYWQRAGLLLSVADQEETLVPPVAAKTDFDSDNCRSTDETFESLYENFVQRHTESQK